MISHCKLDLAFEPSGLKADLARVTPGDWVTHYNTGDFEGRWTGVALRAVAGGPNPLYSDPSPTAEYADTPALDRFPSFRAVLAAFRCPLRSARLLSLGPGSRIREHRDPGLGVEDGEARIHIPVQTNPDVEFVLNNRRVVMNEGEAWYLNLSLPHRVRNRGATDRVHLVVDCVVNDRLLSLFPAVADEPERLPEVPMVASGPAAFDLFRALVLREPALQEQLYEATDPESFAGLVVRSGLERGYRFTAEHVNDAVNAGRRAWIERHVR